MNGEKPLVITIPGSLIQELLVKLEKLLDMKLEGEAKRELAFREVVEALKGIDGKLAKIHEESEHVGAASEEMTKLSSMVRTFFESHSKVLWGTFASLRIIMGAARDFVEDRKDNGKERTRPQRFKDRSVKPVGRPAQPPRRETAPAPLTASVGEQLAAKGEDAVQERIAADRQQ